MTGLSPLAILRTMRLRPLLAALDINSLFILGSAIILHNTQDHLGFCLQVRLGTYPVLCYAQWSGGPNPQMAWIA